MQRLSGNERKSRASRNQILPISAQPGGAGFGNQDRAVEFPLSAGKFEALGRDLLAPAFDAGAADQVSSRAELGVAHAFAIVAALTFQLGFRFFFSRFQKIL